MRNLPFFRIPWGHNRVLLHQCQQAEERLWYAYGTIEHGWSRFVLEVQIETKLHLRQGNAVSNFSQTLPPPQSDLAQQSLKDPYCFDFLTLREGYLEKELEQGMVDHIQKFLLELGSVFAFVGKQYQLEVAGENFFIDLLFYHLKLKCYCVVELKSTAFKPEYSGKLNFYLRAIDLLRGPDDQPTIGMILCKSKKETIVEYALQGISSPIGVSSYEVNIDEKMPQALKDVLPSIEEIENELNTLPYEEEE